MINQEASLLDISQASGINRHIAGVTDFNCWGILDCASTCFFLLPNYYRLNRHPAFHGHLMRLPEFFRYICCVLTGRLLHHLVQLLMQRCYFWINPVLYDRECSFIFFFMKVPTHSGNHSSFINGSTDILINELHFING